MAITQKRESSEPIEPDLRETQYQLVREQVLHSLGTPRNLLNVQVRLLWENHYRVNVFVGPNAAAAKVANSYFLVAGSNGNVLHTVPEIKKEY